MIGSLLLAAALAAVTLRLTGDLQPLRTAKAVEPWTGLLVRPRAFRGGKDGPMHLLWGTDAADDFDHYEIVRDGQLLVTVTNEVDDVYEIQSVYRDGRKGPFSAVRVR